MVGWKSEGPWLSKGLDSRSHNSVVAWFHDWYHDTCVTLSYAQVFQSHDWLVGPVLRIWHVKSSRLIVDLNLAVAMAKGTHVQVVELGDLLLKCGVSARMTAHETQSRVACRGLTVHTVLVSFWFSTDRMYFELCLMWDKVPCLKSNECGRHLMNYIV